jgi:hypothetical protein
MAITLSTDKNHGRSARAVSSHTWDEFVRVYPIYMALTRQCSLPDGPYTAGATPEQWPDKKTRERDILWLDEVDRRIEAVHLRQFLATPAVAREEGLRIFLKRHLLKPEKQTSDRDKIDLLIVQYFVLCAPQELIARRIEFADVAKVLRPLLGEVQAASLECCDPLDRILEAAQQCSSLRDMVEQGLMEQGRIVKEEAGGMFYDPVALVSICRFNFVLRRTFIQLLHADLRAIGMALSELERRGRKTIDCRRAALSDAEPIEKLRQFHEHWKVPFQTDYKQNSSFRPYEQLMCLREDLEEALGTGPGSSRPTPAAGAAKSGGGQTGMKSKSSEKNSKSPDKSDPASVPSGPKESTPSVKPPAKPPAVVAPGAKQPAQAIPSPVSKDASPAPEQKIPTVAAVDPEGLEEKIWEQLIATPPVRGRSMTTVTVEETRVLLSAWEVAAFISASGQDSDDLRRVIVARAMLSTAMERRKRFLDFKMLHQSVAHARKEIPRFQERIDQLKRTAKTDSAVNLGISLKRLLSLIDEAEQLQKGSPAQEEKR